MRNRKSVASMEGFSRFERVLVALALVMAILAGVAQARFGGPEGAAPSAGQERSRRVLVVNASSAAEAVRGASLTPMPGPGAPGRQAKPFTWLAEAFTGR